MKAKKHAEDGFTIIELIVTIAMLGLLLVPIIETIFHLYGNVASSNREAALALDSQSVLRKMADDLRMASGLDAANVIVDPSNSGGWATSSATGVLVLSMPAMDSSNNFIFDSSTSKPFQNEIIYYVSGSNLYRRTLPNPNATGNGMTRSCPPAQVTAGCPADVTLTSKFDSSTYTFYDAADTETADPDAARSVKINLQLKDTVFDLPSTNANTIQVTFRNS